MPSSSTRVPRTARPCWFSSDAMRWTTCSGMCSFTSFASSTKRNAWPERRRTRHERYEGSTGRQWPPTPGPGVKRMYPNGFVEAASIAFHTSTPRSPANIASSLTSAMFTWRNVFSSSLTSSASAVESTGTTFSTRLE